MVFGQGQKKDWKPLFPAVPSYNAKVLNQKGSVAKWSMEYIWKKGKLERFESQTNDEFIPYILERKKGKKRRISKLSKDLNIGAGEWVTHYWEYPSFKKLKKYYDFEKLPSKGNKKRFKGTLKQNVSEFAKYRYWPFVFVDVNLKTSRIVKLKTTKSTYSQGQTNTYIIEHRWTYKNQVRHGKNVKVPDVCKVSIKLKIDNQESKVIDEYDRKFYFDFQDNIKLSDLRDESWKSGYREAQSK